MAYSSECTYEGVLSQKTVERTPRPGLTPLAMLSHVVQLSTLARVPRCVLTGADLAKGKLGGWKSYI